MAYILSLIADLDPDAEDYPEKRQEILDTMIKDAELRSKTQLIDGFILQTVDNDKDGFMRDKKADGSIDLEERLNQYIRQEKGRAIERIAQEEEMRLRLSTAICRSMTMYRRSRPKLFKKLSKTGNLVLWPVAVLLSVSLTVSAIL